MRKSPRKSNARHNPLYRKLHGARYSVGIDEVGRGALAGPVTVAAVCLPKGLCVRNPHIGVLRDSKKLSPAQRKKWFVYFKNHPALRYNVARVYPRAIERSNISEAANRAASSAAVRLMGFSGLKAASCRIFLDGGLYLGERNKREKARISTRKSAKQFRKDSSADSQRFASTITKGDEKIIAIKIASVIAKVSRDGYMERLSKKYPQYGFDIHKGYGTCFHIRAIRKYGLSKAHRLTFVVKSSRIIQKSNIKM